MISQFCRSLNWHARVVFSAQGLPKLKSRYWPPGSYQEALRKRLLPRAYGLVAEFSCLWAEVPMFWLSAFRGSPQLLHGPSIFETARVCVGSSYFESCCLPLLLLFSALKDSPEGFGPTPICLENLSNLRSTE